MLLQTRRNLPANPVFQEIRCIRRPVSRTVEECLELLVGHRILVHIERTEHERGFLRPGIRDDFIRTEEAPCRGIGEGSAGDQEHPRRSFHRRWGPFFPCYHPGGGQRDFHDPFIQEAGLVEQLDHVFLIVAAEGGAQRHVGPSCGVLHVPAGIGGHARPHDQRIAP